MNPRRKRTFKLIALLAVLGILALEWGPRLLHPDAYFEGKSAAYWLDVARLQDVNYDSSAVQAFQKMGSNAYPVLRNSFLSDGEEPSRFSEQLNSWSLKVPLVGRYFYHEQGKSSSTAAQEVVCFTDSAAFTPQLLQMLHTRTNEEFRVLVLEALESHGPEDANEVPMLASFLTDASSRVKILALNVLAEMGPLASNAAPAISNACRAPDANTRNEAAMTLWYVTAQTNVSVPILESGLSAKNDLMDRHKASVFLRVMQTNSPALMAFFIEALGYSNRSLRIEACNNLKFYGSAAKQAVPDLLILLHDTNQGLAQAAKTALQAIAPEAFATNSIPQ